MVLGPLLIDGDQLMGPWHLLASVCLSHRRLWAQGRCLAAVAEEQGLAPHSPET